MSQKKTNQKGGGIVSRFLVNRFTAAAITVGLTLSSNLHAEVCLEPQPQVPAGYDAEYVAACDFNGDGHMDLASPARPFIDPGNTVLVMMNTGAGTFAEPVSYHVGLNPRGVTCGDFDGHNGPDLAVTQQELFGLSVLLNAGDGTFLPRVTYAHGTDSDPFQIVATDVDGDEDLDLVMVMEISNDVALMTNAGDGTFSGPTELAVDSQPKRVTVCDLHNDGDPDLIVSCHLFARVSILENLGAGNYAPFVTYPVGVHPRGLACCDLDNDGDADLAVAAGGNNTVGILLNTGEGHFAAPTSLPVGLLPDGVACEDLDDDGLAEVIVANKASSTISVLNNLGGGAFAPHSQLATGFGFPGQVITTTIDGVGGPDVVVANEGTAFVSVLLNCIPVANAAGVASELTLIRTGGGDLQLDWAASCRASDADYEVYEGSIGDFLSHTERTCSTGGATAWTLTPSTGDRYYLVVPTNGLREGSYGTDSAGSERGQGLSSCMRQQASCP